MPDWPTTRPSGACASQGGAFPRFWSPPKMKRSIWAATLSDRNSFGSGVGGTALLGAEVAAEHLEVALRPELVVPARLGVRVRRFVASRNGQAVIISGFTGFAVRM